MKYIVSNYNFDLGWLKEYTDDFVIYDRSDNATWQKYKTEREGTPNWFNVKNIGSDIYDKFTFIIDNYDNLPEIAIFIKSNLFKYITSEEFELIKDNKTFTPILTQHHKEIMCDKGVCEQLGVESKPFSYYKDGMYYELNYPAYLKSNPCKNQPTPITLEWFRELELPKLLGIDKMEYIPFAPGSGYILTSENIRQNSLEFYIKLRSYLDWAVYPGEAFILERGLYNLWK